MEDKSLVQALALFERAMQERMDRVYRRSDVHYPELDLAPVLLKVAAMCGSARCDFQQTDYLVFVLGGTETREYTFSSVNQAWGTLRSVLGMLAFTINEIRQAEVYAKYNAVISWPNLQGLPVEEQMSIRADYVLAELEVSRRRREEVKAKGIPHVNAYGFRTVFAYPMADEITVPLRAETCNRLGRPFYLNIAVTDESEETWLTEETC